MSTGCRFPESPFVGLFESSEPRRAERVQMETQMTKSEFARHAVLRAQRGAA